MKKKTRYFMCVWKSSSGEGLVQSSGYDHPSKKGLIEKVKEIRPNDGNIIITNIHEFKNKKDFVAFLGDEAYLK